jgi:DNA-binding MarR family transcriptional regulator
MKQRSSLPGPRPLTVTRSALLHEGGDARFREFLHAFMVFARRVETVRDLLGECVGVTGPQYEMLSHVRQGQGERGLTPAALAGHLHCSAAFVTTEVGKLVKRGLLDKRRDPDDGRRVLLRLTSACERRLRELAPLQAEVNDELFASATREDFARLWRLLPQLAADGDRAAVHAEYLLNRRALAARESA